MAREGFLGEFEHIVLLALVRLGEDAYGMTVRREIERRTGRSVSIGAVYTTLARLEEVGYIRSRTTAPSPVRGGRGRRIFSLQPKGARALLHSRRRLARMWEGLELDPKLQTP